MVWRLLGGRWESGLGLSFVVKSGVRWVEVWFWCEVGGNEMSEPEKPEKVKHSGQFTGRDDPRRHDVNLEKKGIKKPLDMGLYVSPAEDGASSRLMVMRHVSMNPKRYDVTEEQKTCRKLKEKDPKGFLTLLDQMERDHGARGEE